jgi:uncharacterized protein YbjT (DUF2867 family)
MKVILFGATGMVGQGVLRECLLDAGVESVLVIGRRQTGKQDQKLRELVHKDFTDYSAIEGQLSGYDACFFCLGVSAMGMSEKDYTAVTYGFTMAAARTLAKLNPAMTFVYVSGMGTDSTEHGRLMWARVKGRLENELLKLPFKAAFMFRPGFIQPMHGEYSSTWMTRTFNRISGPIFPVLRALFPKYVTTTEQVGRAMVKVTRQGAAKRVLENQDLNRI